MKMLQKMLSGHLLLSLVLVGIIIISTENDIINDSYYLFVFGLGLFLYSLNGYFSTTEKTNWYNYFSIAIIGICFWSICFFLKSNDLWFMYEFYIVAKWPLNFLEYSKKLDLLEKFTIPILLSSFQFLGGYLKIKRNKNIR